MALSYDELLQESQNIFAAPSGGMQIAPGAQSLDDEWNRYRASIGMGNPAVQEQLAAGAQQDKPGLIGAFLRGAAAQGLGVVGNQAEAVASFTGNETAGKIADTLTGYTKQYSRPKEYSANEIFGSLGQFANYAADPYGMSYDVGGGFGSTAAMALEAAILMKALAAAGVTGAASLGAGAIGAVARRLGLTSVERALATEGGRKLLSNLMLQVPLEAASEAGGTGGEMTHDQQTGERLQDVDRDAVREAMAKNFAGNMAVLGASNLVEGIGLGRLFGGAAKGIKGKVKQGAEFLLTNAGQNAWEEGAQEGSNLYAQGKIDNIGQIVNPLQWNPEQVNAAAVGGIAGLGQGGVMSGAGYAMNKMLGKQEQEEQPQTTIGQSILNVANTHPEGEKWKSPEVEDDRVQCSAFVSDVYKNAGIKGLGHVNGDELVKQFGDAYHETSSGYEPKAGDLINWKDHVGIYDGNDGYIARNSTGGVHRGSMEEAQKYFGDVLGYGSVSEYTGSTTSDNVSQGQPQGETMTAEQLDEFDAETQRRISNIEDSFAEGTEQQERPSYVGEDGTVKDINDFTADELEDFMQRTDDKSDNSEIAKNYRSHIQNMINQKRNGGKLASAEEAFTSEEWNAMTPEQQKKLKMFFSKRKNQKNKSGNPKYPGFNNASKDVQIKAVRDKRDRMLAEESKQAQQPQAQPQSAQQPAVAQGQNAAQPAAQQSQPVAQPAAQPVVLEAENQQNQSDLSDIPWDNPTVNQQPAEPTKRISKLPENVKMQRTLRPVPQNLVNMLRRANSGDANAAKAFNKLPASMQSRIAAQLNAEREEKQNESAQLQGQSSPQTGENQSRNAEPEQNQKQEGADREAAGEQGENEIKEQPKDRSQEQSKEEPKEEKAAEPEGKKRKVNYLRPTGKITRRFSKRVTEAKNKEQVKAEAEEGKRLLDAAVRTGYATEAEAEQGKQLLDAVAEDVSNGGTGELDATLQERINNEFSDPEQRELVTSIFMIDPDNPLAVLDEWKKAVEDELKAFSDPMFKVLWENKGKGVALYPDPKTGRWLRSSNNELWYSKVYKEYGGTPSQKFIRNFAIQTEIGENTWFWESAGVDPKSSEMQDYFAGKQEKLDNIDQQKELLDAVEDGIKKLVGKEETTETKPQEAPVVEEKKPETKEKEEEKPAQTKETQSAEEKVALEHEKVVKSEQEDKFGFDTENKSAKENVQDFLSEVGVKKAAQKKPAAKVTPVPAVKLSKQAANVWQKFAGTLPTLGHVGDFNRAWPDILQTVKDAIKEGKITYKDSVAIFSNIAEKVGETVRATQEKNRQMIRGWMEASKRENGSYPVADARREDQLRDCDRAEKEALQRVSEVTEGAKNAARMMFSFGQGKQGKEDAKLIHNDAAKNLKKGTIDRLTAKAASDEFGAQALKDLQAELSKLGANPMFNPNLWSAACRYGLHCMAKGARTLHEWAKTMAHDVGEKIKPWLGALWRTLQSYDSEEVLDPDVMTSAFKLVGAVQQKFPDITPDQLYKMLVEEAGSEKAVRQYKPFIKAAFEGMSELTNPTNITKEINDAIGEGEKGNANTTGRTPESTNLQESGSGLSENAASTNAGRTDTETNGAGSEESEKVDKGRDGTAEEVRDTASGNTGNDNSGLGRNASENVRETETGRQSGSNSGSAVSSVVTENDTVEGTVGDGQDKGSGRVPSREGNVVENDSTIPGNGLGRRGYEERRVGAVSEDGSYEILPSGDYHIIDPVKAEFGATEKEAFNRNVLALETIRRIREGDETVEFTPEVMNALANYNGFGRFRNQLFGGTYDNMKPQAGWEKEAQQLHDLMTQEEWESVQDSTTTSFYTPYGITTAMWKLAQKLGLKHGNILEPSMGVGGFFATMPKEIFENSTLTGIDIDKVATKISEQLYPSAHVFTEHYEDHLAKKDSFDFIVSNVPYDTTTMEDTPEARQFTNPASVRIHDFFFLRGINQLRPGGIMMGLTSTGTMDKQDTQIRIAMAKQAELVGAIRLPNKTFKRSAGTDAACDLLVFRKRETPISGMEAAKEPWIQAHLLKQEGNTSVVVNDYFVNNPDNIVGDMSVGTGQFGPTLKTEFKGTDEEIAQAVEQIVADNFPKDIMGETLTKAESEYVSADVSRPNYSFYMKDGDLKFKEESSEISVRGDKMAKSKLARPTSLKNILNIPAGQSPTGKNVSTTQNGYDDFIARHPEFKDLDWRNSELDKKPDGKNYSWKEKLDDVERKNPELAKKAIDAAFKEKVEADRTRKSEELAKQIEPLIVLKEKFEDLLKSMRQGEATETIEKLRAETLDLFNKVIEATPGHRLVWEEPDTKTGKTKIGFADSLKTLQKFGDGLSFDRITKLDKGGGQPSDILTGVTLQSRKKAEEPSVQQSLQMQIADGATAIDIDKIAKENNKAKEEVIKDLIKANAVYETFEGDFVPANVYLSGNVRKKLREAQAIAKKDPKFKRNVEALKKVLPENLTSSEITVNMGASWIPVKSYKEFFMDLLGQKNDGVNNAVEVRNDNGRWVVEVDDDFFDNFSELKKRVCGSSRAKVGRFFNSVLNKRPYTIYDVDSYTKKKEVNIHETEAVAAQMREMNNLLNEWLWDKDEDRRAEMEHRYNEEVNCTVNPVYDADFMTEFPGMSPMVDDKPLFPRKHQRNAFLKFLTEMRGIAAHDAGTGKTLLMAMLCMEMRRTGKAKKPIIFAHNANSAEIARNFGKYYPDSKVLYVKEFSKTANSETTRILMSQIVSGDWDAIVLPHSLIDRIAFTEEAALALRQEEIDYWTERALAEAQADDKIELFDEDFNADVLTSKYTANGENVMDKDEKKRLGSAAQYIRRIRTIRQKCRLMGQRLNQPGYINFEETGIDCCLVDEAHEFKKGPKNSNLQVKGLDTSVSEMGAAMDMLTKYINNTHDNKGVFEFTGTLITNTIPEIHTHMKYVMPDVLKEHGIYNLDDFLNSFTEVVHEQEPDAAGDIVYEDRLTKFINIPDLRNIAGQHIDIVTTQDLPEFTTRKTESGKDIKAKDLTPEERDYLENGYDHSIKPEGLPNHKVINVLVPNTKRMDYIYKQIQKFAKWMKEAKGAEAKEMFAKGMGLKFQNLVPGIGASIKNLYKSLTDLNMSKASMCVSNIKKLYDDSQKRGLPCAQVIFMEKGYNDERSVTITSGERVEGGKYRKNYSDTLSVEGYNMALDLKQKLVEQGFKPEQVAIVAGDENEFKDPEDRQRLADRVSSGEVAVVIAPYKTMGVGVNMQENLRAIHHIDAPWMPGELEQENKRAVRQGNHWNTVLEYRYTMPLLDGKKWSALAAKSSFIAAFMNTKSKVRTIESDALAEEENDSIGDIAETQAAAVGDTRFAKLADAKKKIEQLKKQRSNFEGRKRESKESAQRLRREIPQLKKNLECADIDDAVYAHDRELHPDFSIQIRNAATGEFQTFTDEKKAAPFLESNYQAAARNEEYAKDFIRYRGFKVSVEKINLLKGSEYRLVARSEKPAEEAAPLIEEPKGKEEGKKKATAKSKKEYIDLKTVKDEDYGQVEHVALQMTIGSLQNTLSNIRRSKEGWQKRLDKAEVDLVEAESASKGVWKDQERLDAYERKAKAIEKDMEENSIPAPDWYRNIATIGNVVLYNGEEWEIAGHRIPNGDTIKEYGLSLERYIAGEVENVVAPASEVTDTNGSLLFQPEDLQRDPRQRITDVSDDVNYTADFETTVDTAMSNILDDADPDFWNINSISRKVPGDTRKNGVPWKKTKTETDTETVTTFKAVNEKDEQIGETPQSVIVQRRQKLEASVAESTEPAIRQAVDDIVADVKTAFPGAKNFTREWQHITFTLPNGTAISVDIANQCFLNAEEAAEARKAHGKNANEPIRVNGYTETFDKGAAISLAQYGDKGTVFHESYHPAYNLVMTEKEKAAMEKEYGATAEKLGKSVIEVSADAYRDWQLARQQRKGTRLGKLFQKIQDFARKVQAILTGTENVHNVMRKIAEGEVWNREAKSGVNVKDYLVTNNKITADTQVPVIDITGNPKFDLYDNANLKKAILDLMNDKSGEPIKFTIQNEGPVGRISSIKDGDHLFKSSDKSHSNRNNKTRLRALSSIKDILESAVYVDKHPDASHGSGTKYIELYAVVGNKNSNTLTRFRIVAKEGNPNSGLYEISDAKFYDIIKDGIVSAGPPKSGGKKVATIPPEISVAELLKDVKDRNGRPYVVDGQLNYEQAAIPALAAGKGKVEASISSAVNEGFSKAEAYANRNVRTANEATAEGRTDKIFHNTQNKTRFQNALEWIEDRRKKFYSEWFDSLSSLKMVDEAVEKKLGRKLTFNEKVYERMRLVRALANGTAETLVKGNEHSLNTLRDRIGQHIDPSDKQKLARAKYLKGIFNNVTMKDVLETIATAQMDKAHPDYLQRHGLNSWHQAFSNYLGARRILELLRIAKEKGVTDYKLPKEINPADLQEVVKNAPKEFAAAAEKYYQLQKNLLILMEDGGLIRPSVHDKINKTYKEYCPLMIDYSDTASIDKVLRFLNTDGRSMANVQNMMKFVLSEGSERGLISPMEATYQGIETLTDRAERNKVAMRFVNMVANDKALQESGILQKVPGKAEDPKNFVFTVLMNGEKVAFKTTQELYGPIVGYGNESAGIVFGALRTSARMLRYGATTSPSFIIRNFIRDTIFAGVSSRNGFIPVVDSVRGMLALSDRWGDKKLQGEFMAAGVTAFNYFGSERSAVQSMKELTGDGKIHSLTDLIKAFFRGWENASEFVEASTRMGEFMRARKNGKSVIEAAFDARDVTLDFSRSGTSGRKVNQVVPFFNACLQGGDKLRNLFKENPVGTMVNLAKYIILPSLLLWGFNHDEPWYEEIDPHIRMQNWIIGSVRIPKPQEAGVIFGSGTEALLDLATKNDPEAIGNWWKAFKDNLLPNILPTMFLPILEWQANYSFFREKPIEGNRLQRLPAGMRYNKGTSELSKAIGANTGLSPVKLDNVWRDYTGTMGMIAIQSLDPVIGTERNQPAKQLKERVFIRDFFLNDMNMNRTSEDFYNLVSAAQQHHAGYGVKGKPTPAVAAINKALRDVSLKNKEIQQITDAKNISPENKRKMIDQKRKVIHKIQKKTLQRFRDKF
ncbi:LPD38 domain-containing protein [uncultured Succiniclasticum sp.]|uniref:LPD38 domain-containing protein n=1 Tax=uncultured Succiniclasticum sp. TaxID=1500547 RepID=UPI0025DD8EE9|nr:LPD38 domain-containing protein [uncultured Succiniclasticum sp.]